MNKDWNIVSLHQIADSKKKAFAMGPFGSNIKKENYQQNGIPVIRGINLNAERFNSNSFAFLSIEKANELKESWAYPDDIIFVAQGNIGNVGIIPKEGICDTYVLSQNLMKFNCNKEYADPLFIFYYFRSHVGQNQIKSYANTTGVPCISQPLSSLKSFKIALPPLSEQRAIADILGSLDDKIELNRQMNETLEAMARALFKSWFVDFDPVRAKAEGRDTHLPPHIADLFPDSFEESELGLIPKGWKIKNIGDIFEVKRGASPRPIHDYMYGEVPWIKISDATSSTGPFIRKTKELLKKDGVSKSIQVSPGDLILSNSATCGIPIFVDIQACIHDGWLYFKKLSDIPYGYLYHHLCRIGESLINIADGSVQKNLNTGLVSNQKMIIPISEIAIAFEKLHESFFNMIKENIYEIESLETIRDTLLPKLISGEIRVPDAEI